MTFKVSLIYFIFFRGVGNPRVRQVHTSASALNPAGRVKENCFGGSGLYALSDFPVQTPCLPFGKNHGILFAPSRALFVNALPAVHRCHERFECFIAPCKTCNPLYVQVLRRGNDNPIVTIKPLSGINQNHLDIRMAASAGKRN